MMACHPLSSNDYSNPPVQGEARRVGGGVHVATAAPWPSSAALLTGHAWPGAGGQQTSGGWGPGALWDTLFQTEGGAAYHDRVADH